MRSMRFHLTAALGGWLLASPAPLLAQDAMPTPVAKWPRPTAYPKEDRAAAMAHFRKARDYAVGDLVADFTLRCVTNPKYPPRVYAEQYGGYFGPAQVFDQLYLVGQMAVSAWALKTSDGILLFDSLENEEQARDVLVPALRKVGLDPRDIKWVVITHGHFDHFGGANYLKATYGVKLISSDADWQAMEKGGMRVPAPAKRDITVADGQTMMFGRTPVTFHVTPGHTPGTLSTIFPVTDRGAKHVVGFYGGLGLPRLLENKRLQVASLMRWRKLTETAGVDAQIGNHPLNDESLERVEQLLYRRPQDPNPYVLGRAQYRNWLGIQEECVRFAIAREGVAQP